VIPTRPVPPAAPPPAAATPRPAWSDARRLADLGQLDAAYGACRRLLGQLGHSADGYSLLGVVEQARGNLDAADDAFRKALYLDPDHVESLTHGALVCDLRGQRERAATLRARLHRIADSGGES
jgi:chemotaxis protein methyltransferase WspC